MTRAAWATLGLAILLILFGGRLLHSAQQNSFTIDEPHYVGTGLYLWESGDYHFFRSLRFHPPLAFHLASVPLLAMERPDVLGPDLGSRLIAAADGDLVRLRVASRLPFVLLCLWGAVLCFLWAREVAGDAAGLLAAFLFSFSPTILAYGALAHSDGLLAVLFLQALYAFWRWLRAPGPGRLVLAGLALGLALVAKLTAILLVGILGILLALAVWGRPGHPSFPALSARWPDPKRRLGAAAGAAVAIGLLAIGVIWLSYGASFALATNPSGRFPDVALPAYLHSFLFVDFARAEPRSVYLLGELTLDRSASFFALAFLVKEPVAMLLLAVGAVASLGVRRGLLGAYLAIPIGVVLAFLMIYLEVPLGYRYALPVIPLLCVFAATQLAGLEGPRRALVLGACGLLVLESLWIHPHYLAHFNALAGGPSRGDRYLLDANLDWGQDVATLARYLEKEPGAPVWLALHGVEDPAALGIRGRRLRGCAPVTGRLAISANVRRGLYAPHNLLAKPVRGCFDWLDAFEPVARPGYSILVYDLPQGTSPSGGPDSGSR